MAQDRTEETAGENVQEFINPMYASPTGGSYDTSGDPRIRGPNGRQDETEEGKTSIGDEHDVINQLNSNPMYGPVGCSGVADEERGLCSRASGFLPPPVTVVKTIVVMAIIIMTSTLALTLWHINTPHPDVDSVVKLVLKELHNRSALFCRTMTEEAFQDRTSPQLSTIESRAARVSRLQNRVSTLLQEQLDQERTLRTQLANLTTALCKAAPDRGKLFHLTSPKGRYRYSLDEARQACAEKKAVLATYDQLHEAWQGGLQRCDCGWLADGTAYYPMQERNPHGTPGVSAPSAQPMTDQVKGQIEQEYNM
ncbi:Hyaluronan and proteoglycan link protein 3 [Branchiostoma belcheri]|nr:Hyaluronan and proteoglycan link protein 3 [Branchiostoma belcheri]